jgi:ABC-type multidrug transport system ATPase subunit
VVNVLQIEQLTKRYRGGTLANDGISLALAPGEVYGLLGPNGAGKTTLVKQVLGLLRPTSGTITVDGVDVVANPGYARQNIGFLPQAQFEMSSLHVDELITAIAQLRGLPRRDVRARTEDLIGRLQLEPFRRTQLRAASGGVRRLAAFAAAVVGGSKLLVLDEPTNDVDPIRRQLLWSTIDDLGAQGTTVLLVTHNLAEAERVIDRFAIIDHGRILHEGTPASMRSLVTHKLRLEVTFSGSGGAVEPHPLLTADQRAEGAYLFEQSDLPGVSAWLSLLRERGQLLDFRIGPPDLDAIYVAAVGGNDDQHRAAREMVTA